MKDENKEKRGREWSNFFLKKTDYVLVRKKSAIGFRTLAALRVALHALVQVAALILEEIQRQNFYDMVFKHSKQMGLRQR